MKKNLFSIMMSLLIIACLIVGCSSRNESAVESWRSDSRNTGATSDYASASLNYAPEEFQAKYAALPEQPQDQTERLIVRDASLTIQVLDAAQAISAISAMAERMGGFVVSSYSGQTWFRSDLSLPNGSVRIRVPAEKMDEAISMIEALTPNKEKNVSSKKISGKDVTSDYIDSKSRLSSLETTRTKLYEIMEKATTAEEILAVYTEISSVESDIEVMKGQIKYMEESAAMSSIDVSIDPIAPDPVITKPDWKPLNTVKSAFQALVDASKGLLEALIYIIIAVLPICLVIFIPIYLLIKLIRKNRKAKKDKKQMASPTEKG